MRATQRASGDIGDTREASRADDKTGGPLQQTPQCRNDAEREDLGGPQPAGSRSSAYVGKVSGPTFPVVESHVRAPAKHSVFDPPDSSVDHGFSAACRETSTGPQR